MLIHSISFVPVESVANANTLASSYYSCPNLCWAGAQGPLGCICSLF